MIFLLIYKNRVFILISSVIKVIIINSVLRKTLSLLKKIKKSILFKRFFIKIILGNITNLIIVLI